MDDVKRKVFLDLFASPLTLLPLVGGATALLASWAFGGNPTLTFSGVAGMLTGLGLFSSRLIFGLEKMTNQAYEYVLEKQQSSQRESLQRLDHKLRQDHDQRTERLLARLQTLYNDLKLSVEQGKITIAAHEVLDGVDDLFKVCVQYLDRSFELWETAAKMSGEAKQKVLQQREELINEVAASCDYLEQTIEQLNLVATKKSKSNLAQLRAELDESIRVARRAEERTEAFGEKPYDVSEFE